MSLAARRIIAVTLLLLGSVVLCCGLLPGLVLPLVFDADIARMERLQPISFVVFEDGAPGREALIEGALSPRNAASPDGLIIYTRSLPEVESDGDRVWREAERVLPPLLVDLPGGVVRVQEGYSLDGSFPTHVERTDERLSGAGAAAPVIAVGTLVEGPEGIELKADFVSFGTRDDYLERNRVGLLFSRIFGWTLLGGGALLFVGGLVLLLRSLTERRTPTHP